MPKQKPQPNQTDAQLTEILRQVDEVFADIQQDRHEPKKLLIDANRLSTLMYNIAPLYVDERSITDMLEVRYKNEVNETYMELKKEKYTDSESKVRAELENIEIKREWLLHRKYEMRLSLLRQDIDRKISVIQSYAREVSAEKNQRMKLQ